MYNMKNYWVGLEVIILFSILRISESACTAPGCLLCSPPTSSNCILCNEVNGYYLGLPSSCQLCSLSPSYGSYCATCNSTQCKTCVPRATFDSSSPPVCVSCNSAIPNCNDCSSNTICTQCNSFYILDSSTPPICIPDCSSITECNTCTIDTLGPICSACNTGFYVNLTTNKCQPCTDIANCSDCDTTGKCTQCDTDYWIDFSTNNRTCSVCNIYRCTSCIDGPECISCQPGYYLNPAYKLCFKCDFPCLQCNGAAANCTKCPLSKLYFHDSVAFTCNLCSVNLLNCLKCNTLGDTCQQCVSNHFYINSTNQCANCIAPCNECLDQTLCLSCLANDHFLIEATQQCETCISHIPRCLTCLSDTVCLTCDTLGGSYFLTYPPKKCVTCQQVHPNCINCAAIPQYGPGCTQCDSDYFLENYLCIHCPQFCLTCNSLTQCNTCLNASYVIDSSNLCVYCKEVIPNCSLCNNPNMCIFCTNNTIVDSSGQCSSCGLTQYPDEPNQVCQPCVAPCYSCLNHDDCLTCNLFYEYVPAIKRCNDLCGDSIVMTDQCDNSIGIINDGCTDTCQQEPDYTCVFKPDTVSGQSVNRSICSYNLEVNITLKKIVKEPFKNTLSWTYFVVPYLYGLPGTTSRDFTQEELMKTFVLYDVNYGPPTASTLQSSPSVSKTVSKVSVSSSLTVESVSVNAAGSEVSVTFSYQQDIRESDIELLVNFTYLRSTLGIPNFVTTPESDKVLKVSSYRPQSMIGKFYTENEYSTASTINKISLMIGIMSFVAFLIGLFSKELVGLQMAMLCQFAYISLFFYEGTLELPLFALKSLVYSTGYNLQQSDLTYTLLDKDPPQSLTLDFDATTFSNNFNLMGILYVLPLIFVIPFIPMKAKCIRRLSIIEMGHKWVDLLLGEIMLYIVLFNLQYFMFGLIVFYQDGRNINEYLSQMIISICGLLTVCSILGLLLKPQIYGKFRASFKYDDKLRSEVLQKKEKILCNEEKMTKKFNCNQCRNLIQRFIVSVNENYFWRKYRDLHSVLTYNHYIILSIYLVTSILIMALFRNSTIINLALSSVVLFELIIMRPYGKVSQKLRAIYFFIVYTIISLIRFFNNTISKKQYSLLLSVILVALLCIALIWTYIVLVHYLFLYFTEQLSGRKIMVQKVFKIETDQIDKEQIAQQEEALMRKLMKKYQRVELQFNFNNTRNQLLSGYDSIDADKPIVKTTQISKMTNQQQKNKQNIIDEQILLKMQEENNFKNLKLEITKHKKKVKKEQMKKKVVGQKMLKLLKLDNFNKYEQTFLKSDQKKNQIEKQTEDNQHQKNHQQFQKKVNQSDQNNNKTQQVQKQLQNQDSHNNVQQPQSGYISQYESVQPQNIQEAQEKENQEKILLQQNQFVRYTRAKKIITSQGLTIDHNLIAQNFDKI